MRTTRVVLHKIVLREFIDALIDIYDSGADYIDLVGINRRDRDELNINVREEYLYTEEEGGEDELTDDTINQLI